MPDRKKLFCSSVPNLMIIGPTVLRVTKGNGARARWTSVKKMNWSEVGRPWPPNSTGQPIPSQPSLPMRRTTERNISPPSVSAVEGVADLVGDQVGEIGAELRPEGQLLRSLFEVHAV